MNLLSRFKLTTQKNIKTKESKPSLFVLFLIFLKLILLNLLFLIKKKFLILLNRLTEQILISFYTAIFYVFNLTLQNLTFQKFKVDPDKTISVPVTYKNILFNFNLNFFSLFSNLKRKKKSNKKLTFEYNIEFRWLDSFLLVNDIITKLPRWIKVIAQYDHSNDNLKMLLDEQNTKEKEQITPVGFSDLFLNNVSLNELTVFIQNYFRGKNAEFRYKTLASVTKSYIQRILGINYGTEDKLKLFRLFYKDVAFSREVKIPEVQYARILGQMDRFLISPNVFVKFNSLHLFKYIYISLDISVQTLFFIIFNKQSINIISNCLWSSPCLNVKTSFSF